MFKKLFLRKKFIHFFSIVLVGLVIAMLMTGCSSTPKVSQTPAVINPKEIKPTPVPKDNLPKPLVPTPPEIANNEPLKEDSIYKTGWLMTSPDSQSTQDVINGGYKVWCKTCSTRRGYSQHH